MGKRRNKKRSLPEGTVPSTTSPRIECYFWNNKSGKDESIPAPLSTDNFLTDLTQLAPLWQRLCLLKRNKQLVPTPVQLHAWSILLKSNYNLIAIAPTGSGKTLAFGMPLLSINTHSNRLILVPTRELASQVQGELSRLQREAHVLAIYGGIDIEMQRTELHQLSEESSVILVATPGRLLDWLEHHADVTNKLLHKVRHVVLDEADRLALSGELQPQTTKLLDACTGRTTLTLCSATWPDKVDNVWKQWLGNTQSTVVVQVNTSLPKEPTAVTTTTTTTSSNTAAEIPSNLTQTLHVCAEHKKPRKLLKIIATIRQKETLQRQQPCGMIFVGTIKKLFYLKDLLQKEKIAKVVVLHSHMKQPDREAHWKKLQTGQATLLIATDLAARGLHLNHVEFVVNYDFPGNLEQYVHRCGRAGRDGRPATVYSFFTRNLEPLAGGVVSLLEAHGQWVDPNLRAMVTDTPTRRERPSKKAKNKKTSGAVDSASDSDDDLSEFPGLLANRILLKRADHISDASDDEIEEEMDKHSTISNAE